MNAQTCLSAEDVSILDARASTRAGNEDVRPISRPGNKDRPVSGVINTNPAETAREDSEASMTPRANRWVWIR
jgi:hypothetical protein